MADDPFASVSARVNKALTAKPVVARKGRVTSITGIVIRAAIPDIRIGEVCRIERSWRDDLLAEVVGFEKQEAILMPLGELEGAEALAAVTPLGSEATAPCGPGVRGRVLDALGAPIDGKGPLENSARRPVLASPPNPLLRRRVQQPISTGVRAIDGVLTMGRGQRIGIFAAAGVGKSTLLSTIARNVEADTVVVALIGERGREVNEFIEDDLGADGLAKSTVVVSTSDEPPVLRLKAAYTATAIAEAARDKGQDVVLMMDSVTRFARALRDVGLATGEPPGRQGYPASVYAALPRLFERAGNGASGSITAFYTVLMAGDDIGEPVADETMSLLDGHIILSRQLAALGHYPSIDIGRSKSRLMTDIIGAEHGAAASRLLRVAANYEQNYDKISLGRYEHPSNSSSLDPVRFYPTVARYLQQGLDEAPTLEDSVQSLLELLPRRKD